MTFSSRNPKLHCLWKGSANGEKATGARVRSLQITAEAVKANMKA
jgi:hypothetical protein